MYTLGTKEERKAKENVLKNMIPGVLFTFVIAIVAYILGSFFPILGGAIIGILLGAFINNFFTVPTSYLNGIDFVLKRILKLAIILLGFSFQFNQILEVGKSSIVIVLVSVFSGLIFTYYIGKLFGLRGNTSLLIGSGTAICGSTAIVTISPIIKAKEEELTYAVNTIFAFNVLAILFYPIIANILNMSDAYFGIWAGAAIHDTSSVVAAGYAYSDEAGDISVVVKLVRTLMLIPLALFVAIGYSLRLKKNKVDANAEKVKLHKIFPYFILVFVGVAIINTVFNIPSSITDSLGWLAKLLIVMVMVSVGLKTDLKKIKNVGFKPLLVGLLASVLIGVISISLIYLLV